MKLQVLTNNKVFNVLMPIIFVINSYLLYEIYHYDIFFNIQTIMIILIVMFLLFQILFWITLSYISDWLFTFSNYILTNGVYIEKILKTLNKDDKNEK